MKHVRAHHHRPSIRPAERWWLALTVVLLCVSTLLGVLLVTARHDLRACRAAQHAP